MSRNQTFTLLPLLVAAALAGAAFSGRARAQQGENGAPTPPPAAAKPSAWEYRVFLLDYTDYSEKDEWKAFLENEGGNALRADADFRGYVLNYLAHDGWELQQVVQAKEKLSYLYLRRPRTSDALPQLPASEEGVVPADPKMYPNPEPRPRKPR